MKLVELHVWRMAVWLESSLTTTKRIILFFFFNKSNILEKAMRSNLIH